MPKGERQTTGTAQTLLGAKQIAAQERASKRSTVADYVKTGVGALKSVGDYLQQKQSLEQNQEALTLKQNLFSAQYGDQGEQERRRQQEETVRIATATEATESARLAKRRYEAIVSEQESKAGLGKVELGTAEEAQPEVIKQVALTTEKLKEGVRALKVDTDIKEIRKDFVAALDAGQVDLVQAQVKGINADITKGIAKTKDDKEKNRLEKKRLEISTTYHKALTDKLVADGVINRETADRETEKWDRLKGTPEHHEILRKLLVRVKTATTEKAEAEAKALPELLDIDVKTGYAKLKTEEKRAPLIEAQTRAIGSEQYIAIEKLGLLKKDQSLREWVAEQGNARAIDEIALARGRAATDKAKLSLDMMRLQLEKEKQGFAVEEASRFAARWSLEFKAKFGSDEYQEEFRQAILAAEKAKPGQIKSAQELQELQKIPLRVAAEETLKRKHAGKTQAEVDNINAAKVTVTNTMEEHPHLRDLGVGANEELGELNREGPNFRLLSAFTNLHRDGIVTLDELRPYSLTTGLKEGVGERPETKGDAVFKNLGNTWHHLEAKARPAFVKHLAKTWKKGPAALDEAVKYIEVNVDLISTRAAATFGGGAYLSQFLGGRETGPFKAIETKRLFFKGLAEAMRDASAATGEGFEPDTSLPFYRFEMSGNILSEIGLKNPTERPRINVPQ